MTLDPKQMFAAILLMDVAGEYHTQHKTVRPVSVPRFRYSECEYMLVLARDCGLPDLRDEEQYVLFAEKYDSLGK